MTFIKGQKKVEGSGRKKGSRNKRYQVFAELLEAEGLDLGEEFIAIYRKLESPYEKLEALKFMMPYRYAKLGAIEVRGSTSEEEELENMGLEELAEKARPIIDSLKGLKK